MPQIAPFEPFTNSSACRLDRDDMRLRAKVDSNHREIVSALRDAGASVQSLAQIGRGVPDLLVGWRGKNFCFEVKDKSKKPSERELTIDEKAWHYAWTGQVCVIETVEDAFRVLECF